MYKTIICSRHLFSTPPSISLSVIHFCITITDGAGCFQIVSRYYCSNWWSCFPKQGWNFTIKYSKRMGEIDCCSNRRTCFRKGWNFTIRYSKRINSGAKFLAENNSMQSRLYIRTQSQQEGIHFSAPKRGATGIALIF